MKTVWILKNNDSEIIGIWPGDDLGDAMDFADKLFAGCRWEKRLTGEWQQIDGDKVTTWLEQHAIGCGDPVVCRDRYHVTPDGNPLPSLVD